MTALFVFGTLRDDGLRAAVVGSDLPGQPALLDGHAVVRALAPDGTPQPFPLLVVRAGARAPGLILRPDATQTARLDAYEALFRYAPGPVRVQTEQGPVDARVYRPTGDDGGWRPGPDWDLAAWATDWAGIRTDAAAQVMALWPGLPPDLLAQRYPMIESRAAARARAQTQPAPTIQRRAPSPGDVASRARRLPYARFFGVQEDDLTFARFDGTHSATVTRAGFLMADAVTVLPYDPLRDRVLVVEQFRYGPWLRGDPNPWSLEPVAGRIDPGEGPEDCARREAQEEARLTLGPLHLVARYYPSPGAVTEYLFSYVALADLPDSAAGVAGLAAEAEDIRAHVIPFARLMDLVAAGEAENGPLLVSALWLAANRDRLRGGA